MKTTCTSRIAFLNPRVLIGFALYAAGLVLAFSSMSGADAENDTAGLSQAVTGRVPGSWKVTGDLTAGRYSHIAILLPNGQVLVAGGQGDGGIILTSAELYDPAVRTWTATGSLTVPRWFHTATLLPNKRVLVAAGATGTPISNAIASAEIYDPTTGIWTATGSLATARQSHTATLLPDGQVLVAGGANTTILASAELYHPGTGRWTATGSMASARYQHTATLLPDGRVLVAGGTLLRCCGRGTVRSGDRRVDGDRQYGHSTLQSHCDFAAKRAGAGGWWQRRQR